eukprot:SAG11_NODE_245_length_11735_cov_3.939068_12_plen_69_part_00
MRIDSVYTMSDDEDFDDEGDMIILLEPFDLLWSDLNHEQQVAVNSPTHALDFYSWVVSYKFASVSFSR